MGLLIDSRLVTKGNTQIYGTDYQETFTPVATMNTMRVLLSFVANLNWPLHQLDVKNAFLFCELEEEIYMQLPSGSEENYSGENVGRLR